MTEVFANVTLLETDAQKATRYKNAVREKLEAVCVILNDARKDGLQINLAIGINGFGQSFVQTIDAVKPL